LSGHRVGGTIDRAVDTKHDRLEDAMIATGKQTIATGENTIAVGENSITKGEKFKKPKK
jgi:hypothetical protein